MIEKVIRFGRLYDFYGKLLSDRQYLVMEMFYLQDLSLSEIGTELKITRQGVYDNLKRAEENLIKFEKNLGLVKKFEELHNDIKRILEVNGNIEKIAIDKENAKILNQTEKIKNISLEILEDSWEGIDL